MSFTPQDWARDRMEGSSAVSTALAIRYGEINVFQINRKLMLHSLSHEEQRGVGISLILPYQSLSTVQSFERSEEPRSPLLLEIG